MNKYIIAKRHARHTFRKVRQIERYDTPRTRAIKELANEYKMVIYKLSGIPMEEEK